MNDNPLKQMATDNHLFLFHPKGVTNVAQNVTRGYNQNVTKVSRIIKCFQLLLTGGRDGFHALLAPDYRRRLQYHRHHLHRPLRRLLRTHRAHFSDDAR